MSESTEAAPSAAAGFARQPTDRAAKPKRAVPVLLFLFVFCLVMDNGFKSLNLPISEDLGLSVDAVSLQATLAGVIIGIGAVVYSSLADFISIRKLLLAALSMVGIGSVIGYLGQESFAWVLTGRIIQTAGFAAAETLYVVYVTKYLPKKDQKTYLGFSTAAFQLSLLIGVVGGGFIATYVGWTALFLVSLIAVLAIPGVLAFVPKSASTRSSFDILGPFLIAVIAGGLIMFMQAFNWIWLLPVAVGIAVFVWHISTHANAIVTSEFFKYKPYVFVLLVVFVVYSVNLGFVFVLPFLGSDLFGMDVAQTSLLFVPGYILAVVVGTLSGAIAKVLNSRQAVTIALAMIAAGFLVPAVFTDQWIGFYVIGIGLFGAGYALMYAPLLSTAVGEIAPEKSGVAIGFYNLTINIAIPIGIAYTAAITNSRVSFMGFASLASSERAASYATIFFILAAVSLLALALYWLLSGNLRRSGHEIYHVHTEDDDAVAAH